jgi:hypothetical protein
LYVKVTRINGHSPDDSKCGIAGNQETGLGPKNATTTNAEKESEL